MRLNLRTVACDIHAQPQASITLYLTFSRRVLFYRLTALMHVKLLSAE